VLFWRKVSTKEKQAFLPDPYFPPFCSVANWSKVEVVRGFVSIKKNKAKGEQFLF
jgi:hypothetical protein